MAQAEKIMQLEIKKLAISGRAFSEFLRFQTLCFDLRKSQHFQTLTDEHNLCAIGELSLEPRHNLRCDLALQRMRI